MEANEITSRIIGAAIDVHRELGPGLLESAYEVCLAHELTNRGLRVERQRAIPIVYKGVRLECGYRLDLFVEDRVIVELKCAAAFAPLHVALMISYLRLCRCDVGLLLNFHERAMIQGIKRIVLGFDGTRSHDSWKSVARPVPSNVTGRLCVIRVLCG